MFKALGKVGSSFLHQVSAPFLAIKDVATGHEDKALGEFGMGGGKKKEEPKIDYHTTIAAINKLTDIQKKFHEVVNSLTENQRDIIQGERDITQRQAKIIQNQKVFGKTQKQLVSAENVLSQRQQQLTQNQGKLFDAENKLIKNQSNIVQDLQHIKSNQLDLEITNAALESKNKQEEQELQMEQREIVSLKNSMDNLTEKVVETYYRDLDFKEMTTLLEMLDNKNETKEFLARHRKDYEKLTPDQKKLVRQIAKRF